MRRAALLLTLVVVALVSCATRSVAQWSQVLKLNGTFASSAFFFNATEGMIGTGTYRPQSATVATIYLTHNGGNTWHNAIFPNPDLIGQVTDIYFRDRLRGWATISEGTSKGYGGLYGTTDGGETWRFVRAAGNACGVRETKHGVFYTDRTAGASATGGILFSSDNGVTWKIVATTDYPLGIDFMDDETGFVTTQGNSLGLHLMTTDGGASWNPVNASWSGAPAVEEAWSTFGDPVTRKFFLASEHWPVGSNYQTSVFSTNVKSPLEVALKQYNDSGLTGGVAGSRSCRSVVYTQGWSAKSNGPRGMLRSMDGGATWVAVGGPMNLNDTRFAVTGRGAVVFAGDAAGGVWRTVNGGDGTLSPDEITSVEVTPQNSNAPNGCYAVPVCDSALVPIRMGFHSCDSMQVVGVQFVDDTSHELSTPAYLNGFRWFSNGKYDTIRVMYHPTRQESWTATVRLTLRQADGYTEDTTIRLLFNGTLPRLDPILLSSTTSQDTIDFGSVSLCSDADHRVTVANTGCADVSVTSISVMGAAFSLNSSFAPFVLSPGNERSFLVHYKPDLATTEQGTFIVRHSSGQDGVILRGTGAAPTKTLSLHVDTVASPLCDSARFVVRLRNIACTPFKILSASGHGAFRPGALPSIDSLRQGETVDLAFSFVPTQQGAVTDSIKISVGYEGGGPSYDTTIPVIGMGTSGKPDVALSTTVLNLGNVSVCSDASDTLLLIATGCGSVSVSAQLDTTTGFSLMRPPASTIGVGVVDTVLLHFQPDQTLGLHVSEMTLTTTAGAKVVTLSAFVTADPGAIALTASPALTADLCSSTPYEVTLRNTTCDSISIVGVTLSATPAADFLLDAVTLTGLASGGSTQITGTYAPQSTQPGTATVKISLRRKDGSILDTSITVSGQGIARPPIPVAVAPAAYHADHTTTVALPIITTTNSGMRVRSFGFTLHMNTDLLTPLGVIAGKGLFANATRTFQVFTDSVRCEVMLSNDTTLGQGELCEVQCQPFVASLLSTPITMSNVSFGSGSVATPCIVTSVDQSGLASFTLDKLCGDSVESYFLATGRIELTRIAPNPSMGEVQLTLRVPEGCSPDGVIEISDVLGVVLCEVPVRFDPRDGEQTITVDLACDASTREGIRYLRIRTPSGTQSTAATARVMLVR